MKIGDPLLPLLFLSAWHRQSNPRRFIPLSSQNGQFGTSTPFRTCFLVLGLLTLPLVTVVAGLLLADLGDSRALADPVLALLDFSVLPPSPVAIGSGGLPLLKALFQCSHC